MKKIIILIIFILSGCTVNYNIEITEELNLIENITIKFDNIEKFVNSSGYDNKEQYIESIYEELSKNFNVLKSKNKLEISNTKHLLELSNENLEYLYSNIYSECNTDKCKIIAKSNKNPNLLIGNYIISIQLKNKVLKHNADEINLIKDSYIWYYNSDKQSDIELIFQKNEFKVLNTQKIVYYSLITIGSLLGIFIIIFVIKFLIKMKRSTSID